MLDQQNAPPPKPLWCGRCDERTRLVDDDAQDAVVRCPDCHPLNHTPDRVTTKGSQP